MGCAVSLREIIGTMLSMACCNDGATDGVICTSGVSKSGRKIDDGAGGFGACPTTAGGATSSAAVEVTSLNIGLFSIFGGSAGLTFECFDCLQPLMFKNSVKSTDFLLQHDQPL